MKKVIAFVLVMIMALGFVGCDSKDYEEAQELFAQGNFKEALVLFEELGDYEDSAEMAVICSEKTAFEDAVAAFESGDFATAHKLFTELGEDYHADIPKYLTAIPILEKYSGTWTYTGSKDSIRDENMEYDITVTISAPYSIGPSNAYSDVEWSAYANINLDAEIVVDYLEVKSLHCSWNEFYCHVEGSTFIDDFITAPYKNENAYVTFSNLIEAPFSKIVLSADIDGLSIAETPYDISWNTSYPYSGSFFDLTKVS